MLFHQLIMPVGIYKMYYTVLNTKLRVNLVLFIATET